MKMTSCPGKTRQTMDGNFAKMSHRHNLRKENGISNRNLRRLILKKNGDYLKWHKNQVANGADPASVMDFGDWLKERYPDLL